MRMALVILLIFQTASGYAIYHLEQQIADIPNQQSISDITGFMANMNKAGQSQIDINAHQLEINSNQATINDNTMRTLKAQLMINHNLGAKLGFDMPLPPEED